jgi:hypothetical protein
MAFSISDYNCDDWGNSLLLIKNLMIKFLKNEFKGWSFSEWIWLLFCEAVIIELSIFWEEKTLGLLPL